MVDIISASTIPGYYSYKAWYSNHCQYSNPLMQKHNFISFPRFYEARITKSIPIICSSGATQRILNVLTNAKDYQKMAPSGYCQILQGTICRLLNASTVHKYSYYPLINLCQKILELSSILLQMAFNVLMYFCLVDEAISVENIIAVMTINSAGKAEWSGVEYMH